MNKDKYNEKRKAIIAKHILPYLLTFGITTIATALGEDPGTIEDVYEPFLVKEGFIKRTPRGREVTPLAYKHLGKEHRMGGVFQGSLFND